MTRKRVVVSKRVFLANVQQAPNPPEIPKFAQPRLSRSNGGHPQIEEGANLGVFVPIWLVLPRCEATDLGVFDVSHFVTLPLLQKHFVDFFFELAWEFCIEKGRGFLVIFGELFLVSVSWETKHENSSKNSAQIRSKIRDKIRGENSGNFRSATFLT